MSRRLALEALEGRALLSVAPGFPVTVGSLSTDIGTAVAADALGNSYFAGGGNRPLFLNKYDSVGAPLWSANWAGASGVGAKVVVDSQHGFVYVAGVYDYSSGSDKIFLAQVNRATGATNWQKILASSGGSSGADSLALDSLGNVYVAGCFRNTMDFGNGYIVSQPAGQDGDGFLWKLNAAGITQWAFRTNVAMPRLAMDSDTLYMGATLWVSAGVRDVNHVGTFAWSSTMIGSKDAVLVSYNLDGTLAWAKHWGGPGVNAGVGSLAIDSQQNIAAATIFGGGSIDLDPSGPNPAATVASTGINDVVVSKLDASGGFLWGSEQTRVGGVGNMTLSTDGIAVDGQDRIYVAASRIWSDGIVEEFDASGNTLWTGDLGSPGSQIAANGISVDASGNVYVAGHYIGTPDLDPGPNVVPAPPSQGDWDAYLVKFRLAQPQNPLLVTTPEDEVDPDDGLTSLREAVAFANTNPGDDTIRFDLGTGSHTITLGGSELQLTDTTGTTTIVGLGADVLTIDANNASRAFNIAGGATAEISGVAMRHGWGAGFGGGIYNSGTLTVTDSTISESSAGDYPGGNWGGGILNYGLLLVTDSSFSENSAYHGGGILNRPSGEATIIRCNFSANWATVGGALSSNGRMTIADGTISGNVALGSGGGVYNDGSMSVEGSILSQNVAVNGEGGAFINRVAGTLEVSRSVLSGNSAVYGGGVYNNGNAAMATLQDCTLSRNSAAYAGGGILTDWGANSILTNCTLRGGSAHLGGGVYNLFATATLTNCTLSDNSAYQGGGMFNYSSSPTLTNVTFSSNSADYGGGMYNYYFSSPTLTNVTFSDNSAYQDGGGMCNDSDSSPTLSNVTFSGNSASSVGGGMRNWSSSPTLTNVTFSNNSAYQGGGMFNKWSSSPALTNVTFSSNSADYGGGMYNYYFSSPTLTNVTFSNNPAGYGGGMCNDSDSSPTLSNVTFSGNSASSVGGGMRNWSSSPTLTNVTFSGNTATNGGGMSNTLYSFPTLANCILWADTPPNGAQIYDEGGSASAVTYSVVQGGWTGAGNLDQNPLLGPLGNYGGLTQTIPLLPGSVAIDAGDSTAAPATDQRGVGRVGAADIGAFESCGFTLAVVSGSGQQARLDMPFDAPLVVAVTSNGNEPVDGGVVTFTAPSSGASATFLAGSTATIQNGQASVLVQANSVAGTYTVTAAASGAALPAEFTLTNRVPNLPPEANPDAYSVPEDGAIVVAAPGLLANDSDPDSDPLIVITLPVSGPLYGVVSLNGNGSFAYAPFADFRGTDSFEYQISDGHGGTSTATVTINVLSAQQLPALAAAVQALVGPGLPLTAGEGNSLTTKLDAANSSFVKGNVNAGINKLNAFINEVEAKIKSKKLTAAQGQPLIDAANAAITSAQSGASKARVRVFTTVRKMGLSDASWLNPLEESVLNALVAAQRAKG